MVAGLLTMNIPGKSARFRVAIIAACLAFITTLPLQSSSANGQLITQSTARPIDSMDPVYTTSTAKAIFVAAAFETLVRYDQSGNLVPAAAKSWTISDDKKVYRFVLRDDATWSDGKPVLARDFVMAFQRLCDPELKESPKASYLLDVVTSARAIIQGKLPPESLGVRALDDKTLEISLVAPASYFLSLLTDAMVPVPAHLIHEKSAKAWLATRPFVTNGQFEVIEYRPEHLLFQRRETHWRKPNFEQLKLIVYPDQSEIFRDMLDGKLDLAVGLTRKQNRWVVESFKDRVVDHQVNATSYGVFNTRDARFASPLVRRALTMAIDKSALVASLGLSDSFIAHTFTPPGLWKNPPRPVSASEDQTHRGRREEALRLLAEAGYGKDKPLEFTLHTDDIHDDQGLATAIAAMWKSIGVNVKIKITTVREVSRDLHAGQFEFSIARWTGDYQDPMTFLSLLRVDSGKNHSRWVNNEYQLLVDQALNEGDDAKREKIYARLESLITDDAQIIPLAHDVLNVVRSNRVKSYQMRGAKIVDWVYNPQ